MGRAELQIVRASFVEAELAVDGEAGFRGVVVFLAVVFHQQIGHNWSAPGASRVLYPQQGQRKRTSFVVLTRE
jgi:hypothetical protein